MKRVCLIDLGSNSVRFVIAEIEDNGSYHLVYQKKESVRLSEGMWEEHKLTEEAMGRTIDTLKGLSHMAEAMECHDVFAIGTAAVRLASNGEEFIKRVLDETGISIKPISGEEEAYLGYLGVVNTISLDDFILFDLGGASVEITLVQNRELKNSISLPMGALTLTGQFQEGKDITFEELKKLRKHIRQALKDVKWVKNKKLPLVGIGGTARNIAKIDQRSINYPVPRLHNYKIKVGRFQEILEMVMGKSLQERKKISGLSSERADIITAGLTVIEELLHYCGSPNLIVSGCGLREGLFYRYYGNEYGNPGGIIPDVLLHSANNVLAFTRPNDMKHARYIESLTMSLYDALLPVVEHNERYSRLLRVAALLHDTGKQINYYSHARHSAYVIINSGLYGISHREQVIAAFIAAFSHGSNHKFMKTSAYAKLLKEQDKAMIDTYSFLLALAEALDESHEEGVKKVESQVTDDVITLTVHILKDFNVALSEVALSELKKQCKKVFKRKLKVEWVKGA